MTKLMNACAAVDQQQAIKLATTAIALAPETMKKPRCRGSAVQLHWRAIA